MKKVRLIKAIHLYVSILAFVSILVYTFHTKDLKFSKMSLSMLGINENGWIWNGGLLLVSALLYYKIKDSISRFTDSRTLQWVNKFLIGNLIATAVINMNYSLHDFVAFAYFIGVSVLIFLFGMKIHKISFRIAQLSMFIGILSVFLPGICVHLIGSLAIPETIHIVLLFIWLIILEHDQEVNDFIKRIGL